MLRGCTRSRLLVLLLATRAVKTSRVSARFIGIQLDVYDDAIDSKPRDGTSIFPSSFKKSSFRNEDGSWIKGSNSTEARLHDWTLKGRSDKLITRLPLAIAQVINEEILATNIPEKLRTKAATIFQSVNKDQIQKAPETELDCDGHIAALFLQDYANVRKCIQELDKRLEDVGGLNPERVLDIGYGPSTGMVALNDLLGDKINPKVKDSYIVGRNLGAMRKRAKIILSRQLNEIEQNHTEASSEVNETIQEKMEEFGEEDTEAEQPEEPSRLPIDTSKINIRTTLRDSLPVEKQYDLIIVNQCLLTRSYNFPRDVDLNLYPILRLLSPGGHIIIVERGNALGFETVARARQVMIRPESYETEHGKIPRPYIKGSSVKPQKLKAVDKMVTEEDLEFERHLLEKYGEVSEDDMKFEFEDSGEFEIVKEEEVSQVNAAEPSQAETPVEGVELSLENAKTTGGIDYHLKIIAPCSHHGKCPLQLGDPSFYRIPKYRNRLNFCSYHQTVQRPKFTMELKKGKKLATTWNKSAQDGFGLDKIPKNTLQSLEGGGRPGGNDYETGSYLYLIVERSSNDAETLRQIEEKRKYQNEQLDVSDANNWGRIIKQPVKQKLNVKLEVCAPSGKIEFWDVPKSVGKQEYHDARKVERGDLWGLGKKSVTVRNLMDQGKIDKMKIESKMTKKKFLKEERKKKWKKIISTSEEAFDDDFMKVADELATKLEGSLKYRQEGKKAGFRVDPRDHDGL